MSSVVERFLRYAKVNTQSDHQSGAHPSTPCQLDLARLLMDELKTLGLAEIEIDAYGNVTATLPANVTRSVPTVGLLAHMDTSPDMSGKNVSPQIVEHYDGGDIVLNRELNVVLSPREFPDLKKYAGETLITTDGTTLLGADNKAGVAEIMAALETLVQNPQIEHGRVRVAFTTDEEVGTGIPLFDVKKFHADYAYTIDGGECGEIQYENFNAGRARVKFQGRSVHPGASKDKMINASLVAMEFNGMLPAHEVPSHTAGYEGFYHLTGMKGSVEEAESGYIIRDHNRDRFEARKEWMRRAAEWLNQKYGAGSVELELVDQYRNMREKVEPVMYVVDIVLRAMRQLEITPLVNPVRGGTDGAVLSWKGLPTPNLFTGGHNFHGKFEYAVPSVMEKSVATIVKILELNALNPIQNMTPDTGNGIGR